MIILLLAIVFILLIFICFYKRHNLLGLIISIFALTYFYLLGSGILTKLLLDPLESRYKQVNSVAWKSKNAIVVLGGGINEIPQTNMIIPSIMSYSRIYQGAKTYQLCKASVKTICNIIISGGYSVKNSTEAQIYKQALIALKIPANDIILETKSQNTFENAAYTSKLLKENGYNNVIIVTSAIHLERALLCFMNFNIKAEPVRSDYLTVYVSLFPLIYNMAIADFALHEYMGIAQLYIYNYMGWNKRYEHL